MTLDPDAFDAALESHSRNSWYERGCVIGKAVLGMPAGPYRAKLIATMNRPVSEVGHAAIIAALRETAGLEFRGDSLLRHRRHSCSCPPEAYT